MTLKKILAQLGEIERTVGDDEAPPRDFGEYAGRPADFCRAELSMRLLAWQERWLERFADKNLHAVVSANACGKSALATALLVYFALVMKGTALYMSASERQVRHQVRTKLERLVNRIEGVDAAVYNYGITFPGAGAVILATAGAVDTMQGHHDELLLIIADEAQHLDDEQLGALMGCAASDDSFICLLGNPLNLGGPFHHVCAGADPQWSRTRVSAADVVDDPEAKAIRGLITKRGVDAIRQQWGEMSAQFQTRVCGNFPSQAHDALLAERAIAAAFARWEDAEFRQGQKAEGLTLGVDVGASEFGDASAMAVAWGGWVKEVVLWRLADTMASAAKIIEELRRLRVAKIRGSAYEERESAILQSRIGALFVMAAESGDPLAVGDVDAEIFLDATGVGKGLADVIRLQQYPCSHFIAGARPSTDRAAELYANLRAEAASRFRDKLVRGEIGLPYSDALEQEMLTMRGGPNPSGKLLIQSKDEWRDILGRSPDSLDAVIMATAGRGYASFSLAADMAGPVSF